MKKSLLLRSTLKHLSANSLTTLFMCVGIMIGVAVLVAVIALGRGTEARILDRIDRVGETDSFTIRTVPWGLGGGGLRDDHGELLLSFDEVNSLPNQIPGIATVLPTLNARSPVLVGQEKLEDIAVQGVALNFQQVRNINIYSGAFFNEEDIHSGAHIAVIGPALANYFFPRENPLGKFIQVEGMELEVVGVLDTRGISNSGRNADQIVLVPHDVFVELFQPVGLSTVTVTVKDPARLEKLAAETQNYFEALYPGHQIFVRYPMATARARDEMANTLSFYLKIIAGTSLLIGGTVMMNLTNLSISGRIREIGLRKALGARNKDISGQVLMETAIISILAGVAGIVLGYLFANELAARLDLRSIFSWHAPVLGLFFALLIGLVFGVRPAKRAAKLDPVLALRGSQQK